jgi:2-polyprenyl-6-methoxyphenol hydroxylase-like FAD-dependent oxidoreductase
LDEPTRKSMQPARDAAPLGKQAVVIGAGIAGMAVTAALAAYFERVILLEQDCLSNALAPRPGASQGWLHTTQPSAMCALASKGARHH